MTLLERHLERLRGRTAWITGGKRIGCTVARALAEQGVNLVLSYRCSGEVALETVDEVQALGVRAVAVQADVSERESVAAALERVRADFPRIDILVSMASAYRRVPIDQVTRHDWDEHVGAHILGTFWPAQLIAPLMPRGGHIVNVADVTSIGRPQRRNMPYVATKAAVAAMTREMALEYGDRGIFVNAIAPGPILPPEDYPREAWERILERSPVKYPMNDQEAVEQFALLVLYLSLTTITSGHTYPLDQGQNL
ncbi:MAG TPA: SDR family oxidoreductase [Bryobacteraceae bacterium]|nr:SDR family oxidoreductase [Bryobacteraceae bacterium]